MKLAQAQLKGRIKSLAQKHHADARVLLRIYMMERFLERFSVSRYQDNFIIKGGMLHEIRYQIQSGRKSTDSQG